MAMCIIADAQYCLQLQVVLSERRRLGHVGATLTVLHPTEQPGAQIHAVKTGTSSSQYGNVNKDTCQTEVAFS